VSLFAFLRRRGPEPDVAMELDRDIKGRPPIYVDGSEIPDRRSERRPPPKSPGRRAIDPLDDPLTVPFVPRPAPALEGGPVEDSPA
jgi:hypothetical protein